MVSAVFVLTQLINGLVTGMIFFMIAVGLSLIFGIMGVLNFAHGAFYMLGAMVLVSLFGFLPSFAGGIVGYVVGILIVMVIVGIVGLASEYFLIRPLYDRDHEYQLLLTFGLSLVIVNFGKVIWGTSARNIPAPDLLGGVVFMGPLAISKFRIFILIVGAVTAFGTWLALERTRIGVLIRAGARDSEMVQLLGHDVRLIFTGVFAVGTGLAALGGVMFGSISGAYPSMGIEIIIIAFVVVVVGGLGSFVGSLVGSIMVAEVISLTSIWWPRGSEISAFILMVIILIARPEGLLGESGVIE